MELIEVEGQLVRPPRKGDSIIVNGNRYRMRRGKLVMIPKEWVGKVTTPQTIRKRPSHLTRKVRREEKFSSRNWRGADFADELMLKNGAKSVE
jgi:hypothetical protein